MREIKFRAWDKESNIMYPNVQNHIGNFDTAFGNMLKDYKYIIMQYTGVQDRDGKDIYEGDIIDHIRDGRFIVIYDDAGFYPFSDSDDGMPYPKPGECIVIGNVHENPELLNGDDNENN